VNLNAQRLDGRLAISSQPAEVSNYVRFLIGEGGMSQKRSENN
jgi:hypothetical protein